MPFAPMPGFPARAVGRADVLASPKWPAEWPYSPRDFMRGDESPDPYFYDQPRFCFHVDDAAVAALTEFYGTALREWEKPAILDICASHVSHFPTDIADFAGNRVALGMNEEELKNNGQVDSYVVKDLNEDPTLPFEDNSFDVVTNVVSIDYLTKPLAICKEIRRVLKPGGQALMALSNRCFPTKAVDIWLRTNDLEHVFVVGSYFHYAGGFKPPSAVEVSPNQDQIPWAGGSVAEHCAFAVVRAEVDGDSTFAGRRRRRQASESQHDAIGAIRREGRSDPASLAPDLGLLGRRVRARDPCLLCHDRDPCPTRGASPSSA